MPFEELKAKMAHVWGSAPWEQVEHTLTPVHEHLVRVLAPVPGMRFLDVGTGTGAVARLAARAGADVTGVDPAGKLVETARRLADEEGLAIRFDVADAERLPYDDASFDAVASSMAFIFAPDHERAAAELARVTRPGGRAAFSAWAEPFFEPVCGKYRPPPEPGQGEPLNWSDRPYAERLLGGAFSLELEEGNAPLVVGSGEEAWQLVTNGVGPMRTLARSLDDEQREQFHRDFVDYIESFRVDGGIVAPHRYVLVVGTRR
jgi:SAM-dependent methyltransferase